MAMPARASFKSERGLPSSGVAALLTLILAVPLLADIASIRGLIRSGRFADAIAQCDVELRAAPRNAALLTLKGLALRASGDHAASLSALRQARSMNPQDAAALQAMAQIEFETRDPGAVKTLQAVLRLSPNSEVAHAMLAELLFERRDCAPAIPHFEKSTASFRTPAFQWQYGVCLLAGERWDDAAAQFTALLRLREHAPTRYNLGLARWNAKRYADAVTALSPLDIPGADLDALRLLASSLESAGHSMAALEVLQRALRQSPGDERLLVDLAILCVDHQALPLGLEIVRAGLRQSPSSARLHTLLGVLLVRSGNVEQGQAAFREAEKLAPDSALARIGLASSLMQMGLSADAARLLREQLAQTGPDAKTELTLARALLLKNPSPTELREAASLLERVVRGEPANPVAHGLLGKVYFQLGDLSKSTAELSTAIRLDPADRASTYQLMIVHQRAGRLAQATELSRRVRTLLAQENADETAGSKFRVVRDFRDSPR